MSQQKSVSDGAILTVLGTAAAVVTLAWLSAGIGGVIRHGQWPEITFTSSANAIPRLLTEPAYPANAWPAAARSGLPDAQTFYTVLAIVLVLGAILGVVVAILILRWKAAKAGGKADESSGSAVPEQPTTSPDIMRRELINQYLSAAAVSSRAAIVRPAITEQHPSARSVGIYLGQDTEHNIALFGTLADTYCVMGPPQCGKGAHFVIGAVLDAPGAVVVTANHPDTLRHTIQQREKQGPVRVFDPQNLSGWPTRSRWSIHRGCEDPPTAMARARALVYALPPGDESTHSAITTMATTVIRCYLHAAGLDDRPARHLLGWAADPANTEPIHMLRISSAVACGWAKELQELSGAEPAQRSEVWDRVRQAFSCLADPRVLEACSADDDDQWDIPSFLQAGGTLYLLAATDAQPCVAPLLTALVDDVVAQGRQMAHRLPAGRLDPPLLLLLDEAASIAPIPGLPVLMAEGGNVGMPTVAVLRSLAEARIRWGKTGAAAMWEASSIKLVFDGGGNLAELSGVGAEANDDTLVLPATGNDLAAPPADLAGSPPARDSGTAVVLHRHTGPVPTQLAPWWRRQPEMTTTDEDTLVLP